MSLRERLLAKTEKIAVVGLGYVGVPIAVAFAESASVIVFEASLYMCGADMADEVVLIISI